MNEKILEVLSNRRERIALLHKKMGNWLANYNSLYQKARDFLEEQKAINSGEANLIEETKKLFLDLESNHPPVSKLLADEFLCAKDFQPPADNNLFERNEKEKSAENNHLTDDNKQTRSQTQSADNQSATQKSEDDWHMITRTGVDDPTSTIEETSKVKTSMNFHYPPPFSDVWTRYSLTSGWSKRLAIF